MMPDPDFPIRRRDDGSSDHAFYHAEAVRLRVAEKKRLLRLAWSHVLKAVRAQDGRRSKPGKRRLIPSSA
jgi:hypothetical protein